MPRNRNRRCKAGQGIRDGTSDFDNDDFEASATRRAKTHSHGPVDREQIRSPRDHAGIDVSCAPPILDGSCPAPHPQPFSPSINASTTRLHRRGEGSQFRIGQLRSGDRKDVPPRTPNAIRVFASRQKLDRPHAGKLAAQMLRSRHQCRLAAWTHIPQILVPDFEKTAAKKFHYDASGDATYALSLIHISEPTRRTIPSRMPSSA